MRTRSIVATTALCLFALAVTGEAQYTFPFPGPIPAGNNAVSLYGAGTTLTPIGPGRSDGITIPSELRIEPAANGNVSLRLEYNRVIVSPSSNAAAVLAITLSDPFAPGPNWLVPTVMQNPPMFVSVYPNPADLFIYWQAVPSTFGSVTYNVESLAPWLSVPPYVIGSGIAICLQGFFTFPLAGTNAWPTYATCGWRVRF